MDGPSPYGQPGQFDQSYTKQDPAAFNQQSANGGGGGQGDRAEFFVRILVDSRLCGGLIGKGGSHITQMRSDTGANIQVKKPVSNAFKRIVFISGTVQRVVHASALVVCRLSDVSRESSQQHFGEENIECMLLIPARLTGALIGKGGSVISETRTYSGANIKINSDLMGASGEKLVEIHGTKEQLDRAFDRMFFQMANAPERQNALAQTIEYIPEPEGFAPPQRFGGQFNGPPPMSGPPMGGFNSGGGGGGGFDSGYSGYGPPGQNYQPQGGYRDQGPPGPGPRGPMNPYMQQQGGGFITTTQGPQGQAAPMQGGGGSTVAPPPHVPLDGGESGQVTVPYYVPRRMMGAIIGRGGMTINMIRSRSRAQIQIEDVEKASGNERCVTISGPAHAVRQAVDMIHYELQRQ